MSRYTTYLHDLLTFTSSAIDADDLNECIAKGEVSPALERTGMLLDKIKDTHDIDAIYIVKPLNTAGTDNAVFIAEGMSQSELSEDAHRTAFGSPSGDIYSAEAAGRLAEASETYTAQYYENIYGVAGIYTGVMSLRTSSGESAALLAADISTAYIDRITRGYIYVNIVMYVVLGGLLIICMMLWLRKRIIIPLKKLEKSVSTFVTKSHEMLDPSMLLLARPDIHTGDEIESLTEAVIVMSRDVRGYVRKLLSASSQVESMKKQVSRMDELAHKDTLTGVRNKTSYEKYKNRLDWDIINSDARFAIVMIDINFLKKMNDSFGHEHGDMYIKRCCSVVCTVFAHSPVFRVGGDEFIVVLEKHDYINREQLIEQIREEFRRSSADKSLEPWERVSAAVGYADYIPGLDDSVDYVFKRADKSMYENKQTMKAVRVD